MNKPFRLRLELLEYGVGLGRIEASDGNVYVHVHINNRLDCAEIDRIVIVPVDCEQTDPPLYRSRVVERGTAPLLAPLGPTLQLIEPAPTAHVYLGDRRANSTERTECTRRASDHSCTAVRTERRRGPDALQLSVRANARYVSQPVLRDWWTGVFGLLFLRLFGIGRDAEPDEVPRDWLMQEIDRILRSSNVENCIIPASSVRHRTDRNAGAEADALCFALGSCQFTRGIIDGSSCWPGASTRTQLPGPADHSYSRLGTRLRVSAPDPKPQLLVLTGDQVYVDGTAGLFDPSIEDGRYRKPYEQLFGSPYVQDITRQLHICSMLDDHEIADNWEREDAEAERLLVLGRQSYLDYQREGSLLRQPPSPQQLWSPLQFRGFDFFFTDTRTDREKRTAIAGTSSKILSDAQMRELVDWLGVGHGVNSRPRFIVSASIFLPRRLSSVSPGRRCVNLASDAWDGYPSSQYALLNYIASKDELCNLVFLSGDEHRCMVAEATLDGTNRRIVSVHSSGLYAPFPFANSIPENFVPNDTIDTGTSKWHVTTKFQEPGDGFAILTVEQVGGTWRVWVEFNLSSGTRCERVL